MQEYIYVLRPTRLAMLTEGPTTEEERVVGEHVEYLKRLNEAGEVLMAGRTQTANEKTFGIVILRAEHNERATEIMKNDPAVLNRVMQAELYPYKIAIN